MKIDGCVTCVHCGGQFPKTWLKSPQRTGAVYVNGFLPCCSQKCKDNHEAKLLQEEVNLTQVAFALQTGGSYESCY